MATDWCVNMAIKHVVKVKKNLFHLKKAKVELINFKRKDNVFRQDIFRQKKLSSS